MSKLVPKYTTWEAIDIALSLSRQALEEIRTLARTPGPQGPAGKDGMGFDDFTEELEDDGRFINKSYFRAGQLVLQVRHQTKMALYRGIHDQQRTYLPGDQVSRGGSLWHCHTACAGPFNGDNFTLAVKKGRDGKPD